MTLAHGLGGNGAASRCLPCSAAWRQDQSCNSDCPHRTKFAIFYCHCPPVCEGLRWLAPAASARKVATWSTAKIAGPANLAVWALACLANRSSLKRVARHKPGKKTICWQFSGLLTMRKIKWSVCCLLLCRSAACKYRDHS